MVAFDGGDTLYLLEESYCIVNVRPLRNLDGDSGDNTVVVFEFSAVFLNGGKKRLFPDLRVIHYDKGVRGDILQIVQ